jgi:hypothetical protein
VRDRLVYLLGVAGMAASITLLFLGMRAVMQVGGFCADGGPYVIETHCPPGVALVMTLTFPALFVFGGLMLWKGSAIGEGWAALTMLAWPALFLSLGWNFLEFGVNPPGGGLAFGWLIPGVMFMLLGGVPLFVGLRGMRGDGGGAARRVAAARRGASARDDANASLARLLRLRQSGMLTATEYDAARRAVLDEKGSSA